MAGAGRGRGARRWLPVVAPLVVAGVFWALGQPTRAWVLVGLAVFVGLLVLVGVPVERYIERGASAVAHGLGVVLGVGVGLVLVVAGGAFRLVGGDPLTPRRDRTNEWRPAPGRTAGVRLASSTYGLESARSGAVDERAGRTVARSAVFAAGVLALLVLVDLGIGLTWERLTGAGAPLEAVQTRLNFTGDQDTVDDVRADLPAMDAYPWADEYFREIQRTPYGYWPFTESRPLPFTGEYVNLEGWTRRTYTPADLPIDAPVVWMFGGSTTWGEGQRDEFTIASYLARIAEEEGVPIRVVNYGQRGWTHFQEMILFEQLIAAEEPPDVAIFYDGANEINAQTLGAKGVPTHVMVDQYARTLTGQGVQQDGIEDVPTQPSAVSEAWTTYAGHSAVGKLLRWVRSQVDPPAGASPAEPARGDDSGDGEDLGTFYDKTIVDAERAVDVYERGRRITEYLADGAGVEPLFLWQPQMASSVEAWANANVSSPTINISGSLDARQDVYIDGGHTNEEGAEIVAERIWIELAPLVVAAAGRDPGVAQRSTESRAPTNDELIAAAERSFDEVATNPCALGAWSAQLGTLRAATSAEADRIGGLAARFFMALAAALPPGDGAIAAPLRAASGAVRVQSGAGVADPFAAFLPQLPFAGDPTFPPTVQAALNAVAGQPGC